MRDGNYEIYIMNADGTNQTRLTNNLVDDYNPVFSTDGTRIAFTSLRDGNYEIYIMNANGTSQTRLTNNTTDDAWPAWQ
jgi:TolB protein